jgi:hypothetical protein
MEISCQLHAPAALSPPPTERASVTHCIGGWEGPRTGLNAVEKRKNSFTVPTGNRTAVTQPASGHYTDWAIPAVLTYNLITQTSTPRH